MRSDRMGWIFLVLGFFGAAGSAPVFACPIMICDLACSVERVQEVEKEIQDFRLQLAENPLREDLWQSLFAAEFRRRWSLESLQEEWRKVHWEELNWVEADFELENVHREWSKRFPESSRPTCAWSRTLSSPRERVDYLEKALVAKPRDSELSGCFHSALWQVEGREEADAWRESWRLENLEATSSGFSETRVDPDPIEAFYDQMVEGLEESEIELMYRDLASAHESLEIQVGLCQALTLFSEDDLDCHRELISRYAGLEGATEKEEQALSSFYYDSLSWSESTEDLALAHQILRSIPQSSQRLQIIQSYFGGVASEYEEIYCPVVRSLWNAGSFEIDLTDEGFCEPLTANLGLLQQCGLTVEAESLTRAALSYRSDDELSDCQYIPEMNNLVREEIQTRLGSDSGSGALLEAVWFFAEDASRADCELVQSWVDASPSIRSARLLGQCREQGEDWAGTQQAYLLAAELGDLDSVLHVASLALAQGETDWALTALDWLLVQKESSRRQRKRAQWFRGQALLALGRGSEAWDAFENYHLSRLSWIGAEDIPWIDLPLMVHWALEQESDRLSRYLRERPVALEQSMGERYDARRIKMDPRVSRLINRLLAGESLENVLSDQLSEHEAANKDNEAVLKEARAFLHLSQVPFSSVYSPIVPDSPEDQWLRAHLP